MNSGDLSQMEALTMNMNRLEANLSILSDQVTEFIKGASAMCNSTMKISETLMVLFSADPAMAADACKFRSVMNHIAVADDAATSVVSSLVSWKFDIISLSGY